MTRDEILSMPAGREMDALIAEKIMGWKYNQLGDAWIRTGESWIGCNEFQPSVIFGEAFLPNWRAALLAIMDS